ncbi:N-acetyltransferase family protein [Agrobacterium sp. ES01]|uniref:GNAT family N-acetyltransferase n=1 Tax=Agrobacterium sp. ES01 TaxID=3420714 RepID=UPI003D14A8F0
MIRGLQDDDRYAVLALWHQGWHDAHAALVPAGVLTCRTPDCFEIWFDQSTDVFYVAVENATVLGFVSIKDDEVVKLYCCRKVRGSGLAGQLLAHAESQIAVRGFTKAYLFCTAGNHRAERFYENHGWILSGSSLETLWLPPDETLTATVLTHRFERDVATSL